MAKKQKGVWETEIANIVKKSMDANDLQNKRGYAYIALELIKWKPHLSNSIPESARAYLGEFVFGEPRKGQKDVTDLLAQRREARERKSND